MSALPITLIHLITELNMGGAEQMLFKLVTRMDRERFRCIVVSMTDQGPIGQRIAAEGIPVVPLGMGLGKPTPRGLSKLYHLVKQESVDIVQTWLYHADLLGLIVGRIAEVERVVWGIRCSDMRLRQYRPLTALTVRLCGVLSPLADAIVVNSREGARIHRKRGYLTDRMILIPNGFDTKGFRSDPEARGWLLKELGIPGDANLIGLIARFDLMKDQRTFLRAAGVLSKKEDRAHFIMAGRGVVPENRDLVSWIPEGLEQRVHLLGQRDDVARIAAGLDIAASSSAFGEGFSNTIGEAMACGVPCVVTDVGDARSIVGDTGIVVPPGDPEALAGGWADLLAAGAEKRLEMGRRARERIQGEFELSSVVQQYERLYEKLNL
jgi:glycosyltransferase involved in cell wall biosynthesis